MCFTVVSRTYNLIIDREVLLESKINLQGDTVPAFYSHEMNYNAQSALIKGITRNSARRIIEHGNAGGLSIISEIMSAEILGVLYNAQNIRTETEIIYDFSNWKMVDFTIKLPKQGYEFDNVGVSVTRAMGYPDHTYFDAEEADRLLRKKLVGLILARNGVNKRDSFYKTILHIFAQTEKISELLYSAFLNLDDDIKDNVVILCTITDCPFIFKNEYQYTGE